MIRRNVVFKDLEGNLFVTPEFNGDKTEYELRGRCLDGCSKNWDEILEEFNGVTTLKEFKRVSEKTQNYYHSFLGVEILPVIKIDNLEEIFNDEVYIIENGEVKSL